VILLFAIAGVVGFGLLLFIADAARPPAAWRLDDRVDWDITPRWKDVK